MKRTFLLLALLAVLLMSAAPVLAQDFYVVAGSGKVGTPISSVPYPISASGMYYLNGNLTSTSTSYDGIHISADNVTLDLMGYTLTGPGKASGSGNCGIGINDGVTNVEIRNGTIQNFGADGIHGFVNVIRVIGVRARDNGGNGILLSGYDHLLAGCALLNNSSYGASVNGLLKGNHSYNNGGKGLYASDGSTVSGNVCQYNVGHGLDAYRGCTVMDNTVIGSSGSGANGIHTGDGCTVMRNSSRGNAGVGIATGNNCTIINNTTQGLTYGSTGCTVDKNTTY